MRFGPHRYPVDRYLDESSNKIEMVNIIDDNWEPEPALRPEDELVLRRLHEMLRDTADDLRQLGAELAQHRAPRPHANTLPIPLDDEFNQKIHIEELVNAKFYGLEQALDKTYTVNPTPPSVIKAVQVDKVPEVKKPPKAKKLAVTRTRILEIDGKLDKNMKNRLNNGKIINNAPPVTYKEYVFKHEEPQVKTVSQTKLQKQDMPKINIRSELKVQKVLQLDISPDYGQSPEATINSKSNVAVIAAAHEVIPNIEDPKITLTTKGAVAKGSSVNSPQTFFKKEPIRKISKMSTCESSGSVVSSDTQHNLKTQKQIKEVIRLSPRPSLRDRSKAKKPNFSIKEPVKRAHLNLEEWKRKINNIYGQPSTSKHKVIIPKKKVIKKTNVLVSKPETKLLNNAEYIPYSRLTLGGARVSDIEKEISNIPNKGDMPLSPILNKILSSRENSFLSDSPRKHKKKESPRIFTTSDENLLQEVIDIEKNVSKINKTIKKVISKPEPTTPSLSSGSKEEDKDSYADDFEEEKSDNSQQSNNNSQSEHRNDNEANNIDNKSELCEHKPSASEKELKRQGKTRGAKSSNLSFKDSVEVFEFIHSVDTQENATQSYLTNKISLRETQTSPVDDQPAIQAVHNDLWPMDPRGEVEKMFKLEKEFIKKLIIQEYGDLLQKNVTKPSTSKQNTDDGHKNESAVPKLTQTSPAHVKSVMTSPARTKTRTTSPFLSLRVDQQTSPVVVVTNEEHLTVELDDNDDGISINLSSPRFSLRLPQTSREVLSNLEVEPSLNKNEQNKTETPKTTDIAKSIKANIKNIMTSSSSDVENSSDMTSLGEVKYKLKRRYRKRVSSVSESSETSSVSKTSSDLPSGGIIPLRSEGEVSYSLRQTMRIAKDSNRISKSEGEASVGRCN